MFLIPLGCSFLKETARSNVSVSVGIFGSVRTIAVQSPYILNQIIWRTLALAALSPVCVKSPKFPNTLKYDLGRMAGR